MSDDEIVPRWHGTFRIREGQIVEQFDAPDLASELADRARRRFDGDQTPEEESALRGLGGQPATSRDRRLSLPSPTGESVEPPLPPAHRRARHREALLAEAERRLRESWDPSVHVDEAIRSVGELDNTLNLLGERIVSWAQRDGPPDAEEPGAAQLARTLTDRETTGTEPALPGVDPALAEARRSVAALYERTAETRRAVEAAIESAMPRRAPNLCALLGPLLAARMIAQAGGLDRLARLPAGTVQVLGAEKAFFEHLRGRVPPPRHGFLFLHPQVQGAPRRMRGRIARALAGKVAIAARLDREGTPLRPELLEQFERRAKAVRSEGPGRRPTVRPRSTTST